ncbi:MAG TPA: HNH endonuclease [Candidatus Didemnitutus sp.]|jgi:hypothetical protein
MDSKKEFSSRWKIRDLQEKFFLARLPRKQAGRYWFRQRGLSAPPGTAVLFQSRSHIVASAVLVTSERFAKPDEGYWGWLQFDPKSIRVFDPVDEAVMRQVWPDFPGFSRVRRELPAGGFPVFERLLTGIRPQTMAEKILGAALRLAGPKGKNEFSRDEIRQEAGVAAHPWKQSYSPTFQGMRADQPGHAPLVPAKFRNVFEQVEWGCHRLTAYGRSLLAPQAPVDGPAAGQLAQTAEDLDSEGYFSSRDLQDERRRQLQEVVQRRGQPAFRRKLLAAYQGRCAVSECDAPAALEAAHILPYSGEKSDHVSNGLLLRSDVHTLFDLNLLGIHPQRLTVELAPSLRGTTFAPLQGKRISSPTAAAGRPDPGALKRRWREFKRGKA